MRAMRRIPELLSEMTYEEAKSAAEDGAVALLPAGATEAHGPHLPLSTDVVISQTAARLAVALLRAQRIASLVLLLPEKERMSEATIVTNPAFPTVISNSTMRRRTGWLTTFSASRVVNPTPMKAERA